MKVKLTIITLLVVAFFTACGSSALDNKKTRTIEDLLDGYIKAYTKADLDAAKKIFPDYYLEYNKKNLTKENLEHSLENAKERFGDDFDITYDITDKIKMTEEELNTLNERMANYYDSKVNAEECYKLEGNITFKGSKYTDSDPISSVAYCSYNGEWYLVGN